jgi:hypothetical protein
MLLCTYDYVRVTKVNPEKLGPMSLVLIAKMKFKTYHDYNVVIVTMDKNGVVAYT